MKLIKIVCYYLQFALFPIMFIMYMIAGIFETFHCMREDYKAHRETRPF